MKTPSPFLLGGLLAFVALLSLASLQSSRPSDMATLTQRGEVIAVIDLNAPEQEEYQLTQGEQYNIISIEGGRIAVIEANCPDQICVLRGFHQGNSGPIICLPHQVMISFSQGDWDAITG